MPKAKGNTPSELPVLEIKTITIRLVGDSPLICHKWFIGKYLGTLAYSKPDWRTNER